MSVVMEGMADGGVLVGIPRTMAQRIAAHTMMVIIIYTHITPLRIILLSTCAVTECGQPGLTERCTPSRGILYLHAKPSFIPRPSLITQNLHQRILVPVVKVYMGKRRLGKLILYFTTQLSIMMCQLSEL